MREIPSDIVQTWAPDPACLPDWFVGALSVPREEGFVEVSGVRMHYFRWGDRSVLSGDLDETVAAIRMRLCGRDGSEIVAARQAMQGQLWC